MKQGFTLLETLITVAIIGAVGMLIAQVFFTTTRSNTKTEILKNAKQNGDYALELMERMIRSSLRIESVCDTAGNHLTAIDIVNADGGATRFGCRFESGVTRIASVSAASVSGLDSGTVEYLTANEVSLGGDSCESLQNTLAFTCTSMPDQSDKITIQFQLNQKGTPIDQFEKGSALFQTTITSRN